jgi:hypothetical protein
MAVAAKAVVPKFVLELAIQQTLSFSFTVQYYPLCCSKIRAQTRNTERSTVQLRHREEAVQYETKTVTWHSVGFDQVTSPKAGLGLSSYF